MIAVHPRSLPTPQTRDSDLRKAVLQRTAAAKNARAGGAVGKG